MTAPRSATARPTRATASGGPAQRPQAAGCTCWARACCDSTPCTGRPCFCGRDSIGAALAEFDFRQATAAVWAVADEANRFINRVRPWELARAERDGDTATGRLDAVLSALFGACLALGTELVPFLPDAAARITTQCTPRQGRLPGPSPVFRRLG